MNWTPEEIKALRERLGLTQEDFARKVLVRACTVNRWENGKNLPTALAIEKLNELEMGAKSNAKDA